MRPSSPDGQSIDQCKMVIHESLKELQSSFGNISSASPQTPFFNAQGRLQSKNGGVTFYGVCEGQGPLNKTCLKELGDLHETHGELLEDLLEVASLKLATLAKLPETSKFFEECGFDVRQWISDPRTAPDQEMIPLAPLSFPLIGLLTLSHFCITCKTLGQSPGEIRNAFRGVTGHSQGVLAAAAIARSTDWPSFYNNAQIAIQMLFWIGFECHNRMRFRSLPLETIKECTDHGEGMPSPMLSIRGLDVKPVKKLLDQFNPHLHKGEQLYVSLINARKNLVVGGAPSSLYSLSVHLRKLKAAEGLDQSKIVFNHRKPLIQHHFLPMSSAFHCPHSEIITPFILKSLGSMTLSGNDFGISVYHTSSGEDLRKYGDQNVVPCLVRMVTADLVNWPSVLPLDESSVVVDFGPGRIGSLLEQVAEGMGVRAIRASQFIPPSKHLGVEAANFSTLSSRNPPNWREMFKPRLTTNSSGKIVVATKMTRMLGVPPVMVAGMTPTTVPWDFVSSIMRAGYHAELAAGGYNSPSSFENAIVHLSHNIHSTSGITCNIIYANPKAVGWQIPLIQDLVRRGYPIEGLTIGAGVPSAEIVKEYIESIGLKHLSFKPGSTDAILQVIEIAKTYPKFPIGLQWTGGRAGGHHSYEDFHTPILETYAKIRQCQNIVLIAGSGFGGAEDTFPYLLGDWSNAMGYPHMPFDGVLLGSRMMVAKEAHTSTPAKSLIVHASGVEDSDWHTSYTEATGGILTVKSEYGQPIHKLATRGVMLWNELDQRIFSITDRSRRLDELRHNRSWIIERLNNDFQKPWFAVNLAGKSVEIEDMTYFEVIRRSVQLMYVASQNRWIDASYKAFVSEFAARARERLPCLTSCGKFSLEDPCEFLATFSEAFPNVHTELLHPEDVSYFMGLCQKKGLKPFNFIPRLDENFETWFKKDSLWQAEDIEAVPDQDAQRVCIIQGPVAARYSTKVDEPAKKILDNISSAYVNMLGKDIPVETRNNPYNDLSLQRASIRSFDSLVTENNMERKRYQFPGVGDLPDTASFQESLLNDLSGWATACIMEKSVRQGQLCRPNPIRSAVVPTHGHILSIEYHPDRQVAAIVMSVIQSPSGEPKEVLRVMRNDDSNSISAVLTSHESASGVDIMLQLKFQYNPGMTLCKLDEDSRDRNRKIKGFYSKLWLGLDSKHSQTSNLYQQFSGTRMTLTEDIVREYSRVLSLHGMITSMQTTPGSVVPLDMAIVVVWEALIKPLVTTTVEVDLLQLLHRSNEFKYIGNAESLRVGDVLESSSRIQSIRTHNGNKLLEVVAEIWRNGLAIIEVISTFFLKGPFPDSGNMMSRTEGPEFEIYVKSEKESALLSSRRWLKLSSEPKALVGKMLKFSITSHATYDSLGQYDSLHVSGKILSKTQDCATSIGTVELNCSSCQSNPVLEFLRRHGAQCNKRTPLSNPGLDRGSTWTVKALKANKAYGRVSKDTNPIHISPVFAHYVQLPGIVNHGMSTSALIFRVVEGVVAEADTSRVRRYSASFEGMVLPGMELRVSMQHVAMINGRMVLEVQAFNDESGEKVLDAEVEVEQAPTAYLFTGQGSQEKSMGMALYESSEFARAAWDSADKHLSETYGFSILDIVRNDPRDMTIYFGGTKGRKVRDNYLAMTVARAQPNCHIVEEPIIKHLTPTTKSYTFSDPRGLLYSTQFAQPALVLMELATFADLEAKGMVQQGASYAGHSLGEYSALGAMAHVMSTESLVSLAFYRGLTMQQAMDRDQNGRTAFSMMAANPSRVTRIFDQSALEEVVTMIANATGTLLEIVNFNVHGRQYVCAGHLRALWTMTQVLNSLARQAKENADPALVDKDALQRLVEEQAEKAFELAEPIELEPGVATTPLRGIDVPFHSTYLRNGISAFRKYLETKILEENIELERLEGLFIPNVVAKPFSTEREYVEEVAGVTGSESLRELLDDRGLWDDLG